MMYLFVRITILPNIMNGEKLAFDGPGPPKKLLNLLAHLLPQHIRQDCTCMSHVFICYSFLILCMFFSRTTHLVLKQPFAKNYGTP